MTPRIPRGWTRATERGEGVWFWSPTSRCYAVASTWGMLDEEYTYIVRTDPAVSVDPNECLRLEDEAAQIPVSERLDLGEWPGKPDVPPDTSRDVEILTPHGALRAYHSKHHGWYVYTTANNGSESIDTRDVLRWRELPRAVVEGGRVTGVRRG